MTTASYIAMEKCLHNRHSSNFWSFVYRSCVVCVLVSDFEVEEIRQEIY